MTTFIIATIGVFLFLALLPFLGRVAFDPNFLNLEYFFNKILELVQAIVEGLSDISWLGLLKIVLSLFAIFCIAVIIYTQLRLRELWAADRGGGSRHSTKGVTVAQADIPDRKKNPKWEHVLALGFSANPTDWRFAIIEADTMLDELLKVLGYQGENLGERLKAVDKADFKTLQMAWEAHLVRNKIAHEGSDFKLDQDEARRILGLYERVFVEFSYI
ncbi:MAG: hypothetical protein MUD00_02070 [Candidatus Pacebacteria bacterium]|jgi:hypothetical protein|nr:hypothetical protein [Candidatus Paceibacterota bacterium]